MKNRKRLLGISFLISLILCVVTTAIAEDKFGTAEEIPKSPVVKVKPENQIFRDNTKKLDRNGYLLDQEGNQVNLDDYKGKIVLLDFVYSTCKYGHCQYLNNKMRFISKKFVENVGKEIQLVSISFDPDIDTMDVLDEYSKRWESDPQRWAFLTGAPGDVVDLAKRFNFIFRWNAEDDSYNHSIKTILLDQSGNEARVYRGMNYKLQNAIDDITLLLQNKELVQPEQKVPYQFNPDADREAEEAEKVMDHKKHKPDMKGMP